MYMFHLEKLIISQKPPGNGSARKLTVLLLWHRTRPHCRMDFEVAQM